VVVAIVHARAVISFVGKDYLALKVRGRGEEWRIDATDPVQLRISFMEMVLNKSEAASRSLWVNLSSGQHGKDPTGEVFCNTKYSLSGFPRAPQLMPRLSRFEVLNLCLTYFRKTPSGGGPIHCRHCVTQEPWSRGRLPPANGNYRSTCCAASRRYGSRNRMAPPVNSPRSICPHSARRPGHSRRNCLWRMPLKGSPPFRAPT
jgi:hypothetical protein